jgi:hypothetical protein
MEAFAEFGRFLARAEFKDETWSTGSDGPSAVGYQQLKFLHVMGILHRNPLNVEAVAGCHFDNLRAVVVGHQNQSGSADKKIKQRRVIEFAVLVEPAPGPLAFSRGVRRIDEKNHIISVNVLTDERESVTLDKIDRRTE